MSLDGANGKLWPRNSRRREPPGGSFPSKNDQSRKPIVQQRNKPTYSKQPRPRGGYYSGANGVGTEEAGLDEATDVEVGSVFLQGSKKQSLNHLLNFHLSRESHHGGSCAPKHQRWNTVGKHKYNKEQFLQANCQFVVKSSGDYKMYMNNPDALVDWDMIEQVNIQVGEFPSCPICLFPPVAAKMTRCGHIYCWSCVLHYLALSEKTWGKCPICYEAIHQRDLKSVVAIAHNQFNTNETITFKLMKKLRGSLIASPIDEFIPDDEKFLNVSDVSTKVYCKLLLANKGEVIDIITRERKELTRQLEEDGDTSEKCFIDQAIGLLGERENFVSEQVDKQENKIENNLDVKQSNFDNLRPRFESTSSENYGSDVSASVSDGNDNVQDVLEENRQEPSKYIYFYQGNLYILIYN